MYRAKEQVNRINGKRWSAV